MNRWLNLWYLRRRQQYLEERMRLLKEQMTYAQVFLELAEQEHRKVAARRWCLESARTVFNTMVRS